MLKQSWHKVAAAALLFVAAAAYAAETTTYTYDSRGRLVKVKHEGAVNDGVITQYGLDKADNRTEVIVTGAPNIITGTAIGEILNGTEVYDIVYGLAGNDWINLHHGPKDSALGGDGNDVIFFRGAMTAADTIDGGAGADQIALQGNYAAGLTLGAILGASPYVAPALTPAVGTAVSGVRLGELAAWPRSGPASAAALRAGVWARISAARAAAARFRKEGISRATIRAWSRFYKGQITKVKQNGEIRTNDSAIYRSKLLWWAG